jgi:hypothetical protein
VGAFNDPATLKAACSRKRFLSQFDAERFNIALPPDDRDSKTAGDAVQAPAQLVCAHRGSGALAEDSLSCPWRSSRLSPEEIGSTSFGSSAPCRLRHALSVLQIRLLKWWTK